MFHVPILRTAPVLFMFVVASGLAPGRLDAQSKRSSAANPRSRPAVTSAADTTIPATGARPGAVVPVRRLVGRYAIARHNAGAVPSLLFSDTVSSEVLVSGTLDVRPDGAFKLVYVIRTRLLGDATVSDDRTELTGRITSTASGITLNVTTNTGEALDEAWPLTAVSAAGGRTLTVTFADGNIEAVLFRRR